MSSSESYGIKLRDRKKNLALAEAALERMRSGTITPLDRQRYGSLQKLIEHVEHERRCLGIMETY